MKSGTRGPPVRRRGGCRKYTGGRRGSSILLALPVVLTYIWVGADASAPTRRLSRNGRAHPPPPGPDMTQTLSPPAPPPPPPRPRGPFLDLDRDAFLPRLNARACFVRHRLAAHPLFDLPRLL